MNVEEMIAEGNTAIQALFLFARRGARKLQAHEAEKGIFKLLLPIGQAALKAYFAERGPGDVGPAIKRPGEPILNREKQLGERDYFSIFGKFDVPRTCYRTPGLPGVFPLDAQVNLPERCYSYFLQEWMTLLEVEQPFKESAGFFEDTFDLSLSESVLIDVAGEAHQEYDSFYEQNPPPVEEDKEKILAVSFDGKGVPMIKKEAAMIKKEAAKLKAKLSPGEKRQKKKEALVGVCYTVDQKQRTAEDVAERLVDPEAARKREEQEGRKNDSPKAENVRRMASLKRKKEQVVEAIKADAERRDPEHRLHLAILLDGALSLWKLVVKRFSEWKNVSLVLDIIHVVGYLWVAANALFKVDTKKGAKQSKIWVKEKLAEILRGKVGYVIGALRQILTKRKLSKSKQKALKKVIKYFKNHRRWMKYDKYLAAGLPIATGVVESACGSLPKHRMEGSGKRWSIAGAEAILLLRSLKKSNNNDLRAYWHYRAQQVRARRYANAAQYRPVAPLKLVA